jgi:hypothetical protein
VSEEGYLAGIFSYACPRLMFSLFFLLLRACQNDTLDCGDMAPTRILVEKFFFSTGFVFDNSVELLNLSILKGG